MQSIQQESAYAAIANSKAKKFDYHPIQVDPLIIDCGCCLLEI